MKRLHYEGDKHYAICGSDPLLSYMVTDDWDQVTCLKCKHTKEYQKVQKYFPPDDPNDKAIARYLYGSTYGR